MSLRPWPESGASPRGDTAASAAAGFGRMLSHELKNPLAGARGAAQLIAQSEDEEVAELAGVIVNEIDRARRIAERWSGIGDLTPGPFAAINLHALVREAVQSASAGAEETVSFEEHFDPSLPDASGDRDLVLQAVLNLLINAAEAVITGRAPMRSTRSKSPPTAAARPTSSASARSANSARWT